MLLRLVLLLSILTLTGCNPYLSAYNGERFPRVRDPKAVLETPAHARLIGTSSFESEDQFIGQSWAIDAARAVGADLVVWHRHEAGERSAIRNETVYEQDTPQGIRRVSVPVRVERMWYRYEASFYRTGPAG